MHLPVSYPRSLLPDLGPDLWELVFSKLGRHPKDIVPLGAVCKGWQSILNNVTWKVLCLQHAPGLVEELGYNVGTEVPPGGWRGLYKFMVYCPGLNYPTFRPVCQGDTLRDLYSWEDGCGHVETRSRGFCTGYGASGKLSLAASVAQDNIFFSALCPHRQAINLPVFQNCHPALSACRGIVKNFKTSELAKSSGAAAHLSKVGAIGAGTARETNDIQGDEAGPDGGASSLRCPYCTESTFALGKDCLRNRHSDYDEFFDRSPEFRDREDNVDSASDSDDGLVRSALMTGFVCLNGHIMLGAGGRVQGGGKLVLGSGKGLELEPSNAVRFLSEYTPGKEGINVKEGVNFARGLNLDQLVLAESRLSSLLREWPSVRKEGSLQYWAFSPDVFVELKQAPKSICDLLTGDLPEEFRGIVWRYVTEGRPGLQQCKVLLEDALTAAGSARRTEWIHAALSEIGLSDPSMFPDPDSVNSYIKDPRSFTIEEVCEQQELAREGIEYW
ncbi:F-box family protein [Klebsormidium nitens]|uniref:F-box family protein n=1 Tax=Klebsormidium nitens TaxID=105231 RepID=A0A1Y1IMV8_KLENI|nr:F-box family protein [Klebsormidium nitens]|eukprot:GAQ89947.1 F-box family protein [Klebsormidium nitens]